MATKTPKQIRETAVEMVIDYAEEARRYKRVLLEVSTDFAQHALEDPEGQAEAEAGGWRLVSVRTAESVREALGLPPPERAAPAQPAPEACGNFCSKCGRIMMHHDMQFGP